MKKSTINPIIAKFDIAGINPETKASLINMTKFLLADNKTCGFTSGDRSILGIGSLSQDRTFMDTIILLSAKSSYIIIMIGPSSDFGSQPYFGYL